MNIRHGDGKTEYGPGVIIELTGDEVATAIDAWLVAHWVNVDGPRTITINGRLCEVGRVYVDPSGRVVVEGKLFDGRGGTYERDPIHQYDGVWWFFDETWSDRVGPYKSEDVARRALYEYALSLGGG